MMKTSLPIGKTHALMLCALFAALIAVGAFIKIPVPLVPFTLQTMFATLAGLLLGPRLGATSAAVYMLIGLSGIPVFTQGGGIGYVFQPSFGYILGFVAGAFVTGRVVERFKNPGVWHLFAASLAGLLVIYACGVLYYFLLATFYLGKTVSVYTLFVSLFLIFVPGDAVTCFLGALLARRLLPMLRRGRQNA
jgi:biotin transport system substrate-specific component